MPSPDDLMAAYRAELLRLYGEARAAEYHLSYEHRRVTVRVGLSVRHVRLGRFEQMLQALRGRQPAEESTHARP